MAQLVLSVGGAAIGFAVGGPAGAQYGWMAGSLLGSLVGGKTQRQSQPLMDLKIVGTDYGQAIPYARGAVPIAGQIWWNSDRQPIYNTTTQRAGKGGGQKTETTTVTYKVDVLFGLTDIEIAGITRIWDSASGKLIYHVADDAPTSAMIASGATSEWDRMTVYTGASDQMPDPTYAAAVGDAPAYRGRGSVFIQGLNLGQSGQMRNLLFEVVVDGASTGISERQWGGMGTSVLFNVAQEIAYDPDRGELWTNYTAATSNGVGTTGVVAVYNLAEDTWTFIDPPPGYNVEANSDDSVHARIAFDKFYTQVRNPTLSIRTTAVYDLATKTLIGTVQEALSSMYTSTVFVSAIDEVNETMLLDTYAGAHTIHSVTNGFPGTVVATSTIDLSGAYVATVDNSGDYWLVKVDLPYRVAKISSGGVATQYDLGSIEPVTNHTSGSFVHDPVRDCIYFFSTHDDYAYLYKLDCADASVTAVNQTAFNTTTESDPTMWNPAVIGYDSQHDRILLKRGYQFGTLNYRIGYMNPDTGEVEQQIEISDDGTDWGGGNIPAYGGFVWGLARNDADSPDIAGMAEVRFATLADDPPTVQEVVRDLCLRSGLTSGQFDVTALSSITRLVRCMPVSQVSTAAQVIDQLAAAYFFTCTADDKIRFLPRGLSAVATIPFEDLGAEEPGTEPKDVLTLTEQNDLEIPAQLMLTVANIDKDYEPVTQPSDRIVSVLENSVETVDMQLGFQPSEAKVIADALLTDQHASRWTAQISLLGHYAALMPGDVLNVTMRDGSVLRMRSTRLRDSFPILRHELVLDDASALDQVGATSLDYTGSSDVAAPIRTVARLLDIPILRDADDDTGIYVAAKPATGTDFPGAAIFDSPNGTTYTRQATILESAVIGTCTTVLGHWDKSRMIDENHTLTVNVGSGTLTSSTRDAVLGDRTINAALVGDEVIQFVTATLVTTGVYTLSRLIRGCLGTEWAMNSHAASERFVLLREDGVRRVDVENAQLGLTRYYKGVTLGRALSSATATTIVPMAVGKKPYSPIDLRGTRDGSDNLTITWQRRTRLTTRITGALGISIPLGEDEERYEVDILDDASDPSVLRTIVVTSATAEYTAAQQTADGLTPGDPVEVRVCQISATVGRGYVLEGVI